MKFSLCLLTILSASIAVAGNPVPLITQPLGPDTHNANSIAFTLTVHGTGFVSGSVVNWNGSPRTTTFVSSIRLQAAITATDVSKTGTAAITVTSPTPGGGTSNVVYFPVHKSESTVALARRDHPTGPAGQGFVVGDFNNDGKVDVAVTASVNNARAIAVFLGNGDGTFQNPVTTTPTTLPFVLLAGDFNGDGKLDLVGLDGFSEGVVYLGNGDGTFSELPAFTATANAFYLAAGDFNGDGKLDLVTVGQDLGSYAAQILLGNGDGTLTQSQQIFLNFAMGNPTVGDFNRDGKLDLAIPDGDINGNPAIDIILGNGDGTFQNPVAYNTGVHYDLSVATADLNGDGKLDLVTGAGFVLFGNGDGTFTRGTNANVGAGSYLIRLADLNNNGKLDLALFTNPFSTTSVEVLLGNGDGTFQNPLSWDTGSVVYHGVEVADFNNDGRLDIADFNRDEITQTSQFSVFLSSTLNISPTFMNFGVVKVGNSSSPQTATLTNTGTNALTLTSISLTGANPLSYSMTTTCGSSLAAGANCTITLTFAPNQTAPRTATVRVAYPSVGDPQFIELTGIGN